MKDIAEIDKVNLQKIRHNVSEFVLKYGKKFDDPKLLVLDVAPQDHEGAKPYFKRSAVKTLDIDPESGADYIADLCQNNSAIIPDNSFDVVVCTEVLEHTLQPFAAVDEIFRILKPGGFALVSTPFNFRIHGPLPDCWRFTEHGLRALFHDYAIMSLKPLEDEDRFLAPLHYTLVGKKP